MFKCLTTTSLFLLFLAYFLKKKIVKKSGLWIRIRIDLSCWIRIWIQEGQNDPTKSKEFLCFEVLDVLFLRAEGFSCSLCGLYGDLRISKLHFSVQKKLYNNFTAVIFFNFWSSKPWIRNWIRIRVRIWIRLRNREKYWIRIRIKSMRIHNPGKNGLPSLPHALVEMDLAGNGSLEEQRQP
jgi:hypothetical protein